MSKTKLNDNQIEELYNYLLELIKDKNIVMSKDEFIVFIDKSYKCVGDVGNKELYNSVKESIDKVVNIFNQEK